MTTTVIAGQFIGHNIYIDKLVVIVNQSHQLANKQSIQLSQLKNEALGLFEETIMLCKQADFSPNIISQPQHMQTLVTEVAAGSGGAIAPCYVRKLYSEGCHVIALDYISTNIPVQIQYKKNNDSATVNAFVNITLATKGTIQQSMAT